MSLGNMITLVQLNTHTQISRHFTELIFNFESINKVTLQKLNCISE